MATRDRAPGTDVLTIAPLPPAVPSDIAPVPAPSAAPESRPGHVAVARRARFDLSPEVIVDPEVGRAVQRLFRMVQTKQADAALATVADTTVTDPPQDLGVLPVVVEDLPVKAIVGGERR
jgi:hypothetical protein